MYLNAFKKRMIYDNKIYLLVSDCAKVLETDIENFKQFCDEFVEINDFGTCISEEDFNYIFENYFPEAPTCFQITRVDTLDIKAGELINIVPLKKIIGFDMLSEKAKTLGMSIDTYLETIELPNDINEEKKKLQIKQKISDKIDKYKANIEKGIDAVNNIPFEKYGLTLQHITVFEKNNVSFHSYYAGEGIFWSILPDMMEDDIWKEAYIDNNKICVPSPDYRGNLLVLSKEIKRDFRKFSPIENVIYCLENIEGKDEWTDYVSIEKDGVSFQVSKSFLMKLINPMNNKDIYYFNGLPEVKDNFL